MTGVETTLLVILGIGFAVLLILAIIVTFIIVKILQNIQHITQKAENTTDNISQALLSLGKKFAPLAVSTLAGAALKKFKNRQRNKEDDV